MSIKLKIVGWAYIVSCGAGLLVGTVICLQALLSSDDQSRALYYVGPMFLMVATFYFGPGVVGGIGLLHARNWARVLLIVLSALSLLLIPVGTVYGALALWVLLGADANRLFSRGAAEPLPLSPKPTTPPRPLLAPRHNFFIVTLAGVAALFVVIFGTGSRLTGQPSPDWIPLPLYVGAILVLAGALVLLVQWLRTVVRPTMPSVPMPWTLYRDHRQLAELERKQAEERRQRLAALAANPARRKYVALIERGESWEDAQIAYHEDPNMLATCAHLQPIERAMRSGGIRIKYMNGFDVQADCRIDRAELGRRFALPDSVHYAEAALDERGANRPAAWIVCLRCRSLIDAVHGENATPRTPVFPKAGPAANPRVSS